MIIPFHPFPIHGMPSLLLKDTEDIYFFNWGKDFFSDTDTVSLTKKARMIWGKKNKVRFYEVLC